MQTKRTVGYAPRTRALALDLAKQNGSCVGCPGCQGICQALLDAMMIPDLVLKDTHA